MKARILVPAVAALFFAAGANANEQPVSVSADGSVAYATGLSVPLPTAAQDVAANPAVGAPFGDAYLAEPAHASGIPVVDTSRDRATVQREGVAASQQLNGLDATRVSGA